MKKFLSLVLALVMTMSLVTVSAGAKDFNDSDDLSGEQYEEAVNVMSEMGIIDGYAGGNFQPQGTLTRGAAAKIIACMMLGKTTAEALGTSAAPFKDVPAGSTFAGYIAYCVESGLIDGYADGTFRPGNTLTGFAFLKMLLTALGYDSAIEGYTGTNWTVNVAGRAQQVGLTNGNEDFVGSRAATREEACLYAVNALKATLVEYDSKGTNVTVNGATVAIGASKPTYVTSNVAGAATAIDDTKDNTTHDYTVEFAEKYQPDLKLSPDTDDFERPAHTWSWKNREIGTYMNYDELVAEYTTGVTGRDLYDVLTATTIREYDLYAYLDGAKNDGGKGTDAEIIEENLVRSNNEDLNGTGNGVLTQVFVDDDDEEITVVSINTYLAKATADYSDSKEYAPLSVYVKDSKNPDSFNVDVEEVPEVEDVTDETFYLVNISYKYDTKNGEVVAINDAEVLENSTVTKWSDSKDLVVSKLTTDGTQYDAAAKAFYDDENLTKYNESLLTDMTYNIYLDQYGYVIGVELYEGTLKYVFITGYDRSQSNLAIKTADAAAIFLDGTMDVIEVNVTDTNKNINKADTNKYFDDWSAGGEYAHNRWYTYTQDEDGVYTLKPAVQSFSTKTTEIPRYDATKGEVTINCSNVRLSDSLDTSIRAYGEDESIYITVDQDLVDTKDDEAVAITEVTGTYTGVQNVDLEIQSDEVGGNYSVHTVYDDDHYIIASIVVGDASGAVANYAYILSGAKSEEKIGDTYYWEFKAILDGEIQTLTAKSKYTDIIDELDVGKVQELRFDADDYVVKVVPADDIYGYVEAVDGTKDTADYEIYLVDSDDAPSDELELMLQGRTMYITDDQDDYGLTLASDAKAVVIQDENGKGDVETEFDSVSAAISYLADHDDDTPELEYVGKIVAVLNDNGTAAWVVFDSNTELVTGTNRPSHDDDNDGDVRYVRVDLVNDRIILNEKDKPGPGAWSQDEKDAVESAARAALNSIGYKATSGVSFGGGSGSGDTIDAVNMDSPNGTEFTFTIVWG